MNIIKKLKNLIKQYGPFEIGNNFNIYFKSDDLDKIFESEIKINLETARQKRSSLDIKRGKFFEIALEILLNSAFKITKFKNIKCASPKKLPKNHKNILNKIILKRKDYLAVKKPDIDLVVYKKDEYRKILLISVKGTSRERIGQFLSNIFIFDPKVIKVKYPKSIYQFEKDVPIYKMVFVCFDMAKRKDFSSDNKESIDKKIKSSNKQIEVLLIDDDPNIGYGIFALNNLYKLHKVGNFSDLVGKIISFFSEKV